MTSPRLEYISNHPLRCSTMDNIHNFSRTGDPHTLTSTIVGGGVSTPRLISQKMGTTQDMMKTLDSSSIPLLIGPTQPMSETSCSSFVSSDFSFGMSTMGIPNIVASSTLLLLNLSFNAGSSLIHLKGFPNGRRKISPSNPSQESGNFAYS